jgi:hypothetical protein
MSTTERSGRTDDTDHAQRASQHYLDVASPQPWRNIYYRR